MDENNKIMKNIEATMIMEGLVVENDNKELIFKYLNNEITEQEGIDYIKSKYK